MRTLSKSGYEELLARSEIVEKDRHGVKVVRLSGGNYLKTFWYRRLISSRRIYPEWLRFVLHAGALRRRNIPTVTVLETLRIPHLKRTAVIYAPLEGRTLRQAQKAGDFDSAFAGRLGRFIAALHRQGIDFHSLHMGNILQCPDQTYGLIDISNMRIVPWPLSSAARLRNFNHLFRYSNDLRILTEAGIQEFIAGYMEACSSPQLRHRLLKTYQQWAEK
jgi:hypothetical protein